MTTLNQALFFKTFAGLPFGWFGFTVCATCITWWHGTAIYFIYLLLSVNLIGGIFVFKNYKNFYLLKCALFTLSIAFNFFGILLLFFPELNTNTLIFLSLPPTVSLIMVLLLFSAFAFFAIKKNLTIDYDAMKKSAYKTGFINKLDGSFFLDNRRSDLAGITFKAKAPSKYKTWITTLLVSFFLIALGPFRVLGSTMERNGNTPFNAIFFLIASYVITWICYLIAVNGYAQYQLIKKIEQDLQVELKPVFQSENTSLDSA